MNTSFLLSGRMPSSEEGPRYESWTEKYPRLSFIKNKYEEIMEKKKKDYLRF
jgi:hypothetical protein